MLKKNVLQTKLSKFSWQGLNSDGKKMSGEIHAINIRFAKAKLINKGIELKKIHKKSSRLFNKRKNTKITSKDITSLFHQLATLFIAGIPISQALLSISLSIENSLLKEILIDIKNNVCQGNTLADSFKNHPKYFDNLTCHFIFAGEQTGKLDVILTQIAAQKEKTDALKMKVKKALTYPCIVLLVSITITSILLIFVVPQLSSLFGELGAKLPLPTRIVIGASNFIKQKWWILSLIIFAFSYIFTITKKKSEKLSSLVDFYILKIPIFGKLIQYAIIARLTRMLAMIFSTGISLLDALHTLANIANNKCFVQAILSARDNVRKGQSLHNSLQSTLLFPNMLIQMVAIGEEAGKLDNMLEKVADFYENEINHMTDTLNQLLEPIVMLILGIIIGGIIIAMYLPIFQLGMAI